MASLKSAFRSRQESVTAMTLKGHACDLAAENVLREPEIIQYAARAYDAG